MDFAGRRRFVEEMVGAVAGGDLSTALSLAGGVLGRAPKEGGKDAERAEARLLLELLALSFLVYSASRGSRWRPRDRTVVYRITEAVGRWSMIDIFMISILVALITLENIATIEAGIGAICFAAVVIVTIFAAMSFDPRLIWDALEEGHDHD